MRSRAGRAAAGIVLATGVVLAAGACSSDPPYQEGDCVLLAPDTPTRPVDCYDLHASRIARITGSPGFHDCAGPPAGTVEYSYQAADEPGFGMCIEPPGVDRP